jgi:hypothetical protein
MATNYRRGVDLERRTQKTLEAAGYDTIRSAGSHGVFDVVAWSWGSVRLIQVKQGCKPSPIEREKIEMAEVPPNVVKEIWTWRKAGGRWRADVEALPAKYERARR